MALTFRRWIAAAIVGCGLLTLGLFTSKRSARNYRDDFFEHEARGMGPDSARLVTLRRDADSLDDLQHRLTTLLRQATIRDSVLSSLGTKVEPFTIGLDSRFPAQSRDRFRAAAVSAWAATTSSTPPRVPVVVAVVLDSSRQLGRSPPYVTLAEFSATHQGGPVCIAIVQAGTADPFVAKRVDLDTTLLANRMLGQCAFEAAFGAPGPRIAAWLRENPTLAQDARWNVASLPVLDDPSMQSDYLAANEMGMMESLLRKRFVETPSRRFLGAAALACDAGDPDLCTSTVAARENENERFFALPYWPGSLFGLGPNRLGPREVRLLADVAHDFGPAKFATFWQSTQPLPAAFQDAMHESLGEWTFQWVQRVYGPVRVGPALTASTVLDALVLMVLGIGVAIGIVSRRTVA